MPSLDESPACGQAPDGHPLQHGRSPPTLLLAHQLVALGAKLDTATITNHTEILITASAKYEAAVEWLM